MGTALELAGTSDEGEPLIVAKANRRPRGRANLDNGVGFHASGFLGLGPSSTGLATAARAISDRQRHDISPIGATDPIPFSLAPGRRPGDLDFMRQAILSDVVEAIGDTPLIRLRRASEATGCEILGKAEFMNPGASIKDRAALYIVRDAERRDLLRPGGQIVEGTAGNTGIGLALVANALGYKATIVIPRTQSQEKKDAIRLMGAELVEVDAAPYSSPANYVRYSGRLAEELAAREPAGVVWANQFDNLANRDAHEETTGPEIWRQTGGQVDGFICSVGTGGTLAGVAMALRRENPKVAIGLADPHGASIFSYYAEGQLRAEGASISEGIGQSRITANLEGLGVDYPYRVSDTEMLEAMFDLAEHEGLVMGGSTGINLAGAVRLARDMGPGKTIVTILADHGSRYQTKLYNPAFLAERGLPVPQWLTP